MLPNASGTNGAGGRSLPPSQVGFLVLVGSVVLLVILAVLAYFLWSCIVLFSSLPAMGEGCNGESPIWMFSFISVCFFGFSIASGSGKDMEGNVGLVGYFLLASSIALTIWGLAIWISMTGSCRSIFERKYPSLLLLFDLDVVLLSMQAVLIVLLVLCGALFLGLVGSTWNRADEARRFLTAGEYNDIPDQPAHEA
mmetsp:Transcript_32499/g.73015  ORF Transcript_32499/g.73015 Transcript_32499/m.73015 type:complete len:196 (+) Transcript_32499:162-749(+)